MTEITVFAAFLVLFVNFLSFGKSQNCPKTYERFLGYVIDSQRSGAEIFRRFYDAPPATDIIPLCSSLCSENLKCGAFSIDLGAAVAKVSCTLYDLSLYSDISENFAQNWLHRKAGATTFRAFCTTQATENLCSTVSIWAFDSVPGWSLYDSRTTKTQRVQNRQECLDLCIAETGFVCRSAAFNSQTQSSLEKNCRLSKYDRRSASYAFVPRNTEEVYMEYVCGSNVKFGCSFTTVVGLAMAYTWRVEPNVLSESDCMERCVALAVFVCRGYVFEHETKLCRMTAEDFHVMQALDGSGVPEMYFQRMECVEATVTCSTRDMVVLFSLNREFNGKIYAVNAIEDCKFDISEQLKFEITLPIDPGSRKICAIVEESPNVFSAIMMLQYHDQVMTGRDRMFKLMCTFVAAEQLVSDSVELINSPTSPTPHIVVGDREEPRAFLRIVDGENQAVKSAELDQTLYAEVVLIPENGTQSEYVLFVTSCEAFTETNRIMLVDTSGCPIDPTVFGGFEIKPDSDGRIVRAAFRGFKFEGQNKVNLNCNVNFCFKACEPVICQSTLNSKAPSYGRKKRSQPKIALPGNVNNVHGEWYVGTPPVTFLSNVTEIDHHEAPLFISRVSALTLVVIGCLMIVISIVTLVSIVFWLLRHRTCKRSASINLQ